MLRRPVLASVLCGAMLVVWGPEALDRSAQAAERHGPLAQVESWGYQLAAPRIEHIAASPHDLVVIDYSRDGSDDGAFTPKEIARMKERPGGGKRLLLAYLSIGEAEVYRDYWRWYWGGKWYSRPIGWLFAPSWLGPENRHWRGNFAVRYWDEDWQRRIVGDGGYLERILAAGFDGVYLDKIDASIEAIAESRPSARDDMRTLVRRIADKGRQQRVSFLVVPQNGEELLSDDAYAGIIDGIGKEDLLYGEFNEKTANPEDVVKRRIALLGRATAKGKTVLAVEYLDKPDQIAAARARLERLGYVAYFGDRPLATLRYGDLPETARGR
jgi:cysteinyl-tRNA synthetase